MFICAFGTLECTLNGNGSGSNTMSKYRRFVGDESWKEASVGQIISESGSSVEDATAVVSEKAADAGATADEDKVDSPKNDVEDSSTKDVAGASLSVSQQSAVAGEDTIGASAEKSDASKNAEKSSPEESSVDGEKPELQDGLKMGFVAFKLKLSGNNDKNGQENVKNEDVVEQRYAAILEDQLLEFVTKLLKILGGGSLDSDDESESEYFLKSVSITTEAPESKEEASAESASKDKELKASFDPNVCGLNLSGGSDGTESDSNGDFILITETDTRSEYPLKLKITSENEVPSQDTSDDKEKQFKNQMLSIIQDSLNQTMEMVDKMIKVIAAEFQDLLLFDPSAQPADPTSAQKPSFD
jgi:hypothetical protein